MLKLLFVITRPVLDFSQCSSLLSPSSSDFKVSTCDCKGLKMESIHFQFTPHSCLVPDVAVLTCVMCNVFCFSGVFPGHEGGEGDPRGGGGGQPGRGPHRR